MAISSASLDEAELLQNSAGRGIVLEVTGREVGLPELLETEDYDRAGSLGGDTLTPVIDSQ